MLLQELPADLRPARAHARPQRLPQCGAQRRQAARPGGALLPPVASLVGLLEFDFDEASRSHGVPPRPRRAGGARVRAQRQRRVHIRGLRRRRDKPRRPIQITGREDGAQLVRGGRFLGSSLGPVPEGGLPQLRRAQAVQHINRLLQWLVPRPQPKLGHTTVLGREMRRAPSLFGLGPGPRRRRRAPSARFMRAPGSGWPRGGGGAGGEGVCR